MEINVKGEYAAEAWIQQDDGTAVLEVTDGIVWTPADLRKFADALHSMAGTLEARPFHFCRKM